MYPHIRPRQRWLHDPKRRTVYRPGGSYTLPDKADGGLILHVEYGTMSAATGPGELIEDRGYLAGIQEALEMWTKSRGLEAVSDEEGARLWAGYEAEWRAK